jgi:S-adenosylmethionine hydrolase
MPRPVIALLTDFGTRDHYVSAMKGVVLGICPEATLVDITHDVAPQDVRGAAEELAACYRFFPSGTIFLVVVDPGVGSPRRALAAAACGFIFVAPDNGVLSLVVEGDTPRHAVAITEPRYALGAVSRTFEGRDRFAPAAAWLATGVPLSALGPPIDDLHRLDPRAPTVGEGTIAGEVVRVDRFGNLITNIDRRLLDQMTGRALVVRVADHEIAGVGSTYCDVAPGAVCALVGSSERLELAVNGGSAATVLGAARGTAVLVIAGIGDRISRPA